MKLIILNVIIILIECRKVFDIEDEYLSSNLIKDEENTSILYRLTLSDVPSFTNAEDFKVDLLASQFIIVNVNNTNIQWRIKLDNRVPNHLIFYPEFTVSLLSANKKLSTWEVFIRIPKVFNFTPQLLKT
ncbi:hypothetical protein TpMuguga_02g00779 [Theileria parva strain Muguga]|uniref:Uncharacterized protein n=1 Tax=Theileria parva TaxID=5875 RepID=Q4N460_THEPA|nr:uncharacterized protein TpMuguga_02g00779 [Theileria parva strain Muguga]EAN33063.1 hypothetical protein TpMuguga_02g00779 [Theileria parva strain Muguga]|eukprot:XP_765346.1 hypothetical protein [Theileria parva strain Muguga]